MASCPSAVKELTTWLPAFAVLLYTVLNVCVPFQFGVLAKMWNSIVSVPGHCLFIYFNMTENCVYNFADWSDCAVNLELTFPLIFDFCYLPTGLAFYLLFRPFAGMQMLIMFQAHALLTHFL